MNNNISLMQVHIGRKQLYYFLARVFLDVPDDDLYTYTLNILPAFEILSKHNKALEEGYVELSNFLQKRINLQGESLKLFDNGMLNDYSKLFCKSEGLSLYQSMYIAPYGENIKETLYNLQKQYGFDTGQENIDLSDHISYELMFMSYLSKGIAQNIVKGDMEQVNNLMHLQKMFLEEHLLKWVEMFSKSVIGFAESVSFYAPVCYFMIGFLKDDFEMVKESLS